MIGKKIGKHLSEIHGINTQVHAQSYGPVVCVETHKLGSTASKLNGDWISRVKANNEDISEYAAKMSKAVSVAVMSDPGERLRRSALAKTTITSWAKSEEGRASSSKVAKMTSARPEIISARTENLRAWREREPEKFQAIVMKMLSYRTSKPERATLLFLQSTFPSYAFVGNQRLMNKKLFLSTKSNRRQIDIMSQSHRVIVEVDGFLHFNEVPGWCKLEKIREKDIELNVAVAQMGYAIVRISYDQWNNAGELSDACKEQLITAVSSPIGSTRIGAMYAVAMVGI